MSASDIRVLNSSDPNFNEEFQRLRERARADDLDVEATVRNIITDVRGRGDNALLEYVHRLDNYQPKTPTALEVPPEQFQPALDSLPETQRLALEEATHRIEDYHQRQADSSWHYRDVDDTLLGQQIRPLERVGVYVPGGKAAYPSTVLMNAIPAKIAGVPKVVMAVPVAGGNIDNLVLAAASLARVDQVFMMGGAHAIAAMAYGTATVPRVDKIVGPGNAYVAAAKRMVFGDVGIDMIAGPSEVVVLCDGATDADWIAMDLFAQAEHDENAQAILISLDAAFTQNVQQAIERLLGEMERQETIKKSLDQYGALITVRGLDEALELINQLAPEHLELSIEDPMPFAKRVHHAGAIFLGRYTAEVLGDYCAGPNHVLPTSGTARFSSPLGVYDFQKRTSLLMCTKEGASNLGKTAAILARGEGLTAHARSAEFRTKQ